VTNTFKVLEEFLNRFDNEVEGRQSPGVPEEIRTKLRALASGTLPKTQHAEVFSILSQNPEWIAELAREIKALHPSSEEAG
jgi:hypothetical protein